MSSERTSISVKDVSKTYHLFERPLDRLKLLLGIAPSASSHIFDALKDVAVTPLQPTLILTSK